MVEIPVTVVMRNVIVVGIAKSHTYEGSKQSPQHHDFLVDLLCSSGVRETTACSEGQPPSFYTIQRCHHHWTSQHINMFKGPLH